MTGMFGRDREYRAISALLRRGGEGPALVVIEGPPGAGRTRLLEEIGAGARAAGRTVLRLPAGPVDVAGLARQLASAAARPAGDGPAPLLIDDPQWTDPGVAAALSAAYRTARVLPVLARRTGLRLPGLDPLDLGRARRVPLDPLGPEAAAAVLAALFGAEPDAALRELAAVAGGLPGPLIELARGLRDEHLVAVEGGHATLRDPRLPAPVRDRIGHRVGLLTPAARHLVQVATTLDEDFDLVEVAGLLGGPVAALLPAVDEALTAGLLADRGEWLSFAHALVRAEVSRTIPRAVRVALHDGAACLDRGAPGGFRTRQPMAGGPRTAVADLHRDAARPGRVRRPPVARPRSAGGNPFQRSRPGSRPAGAPGAAVSQLSDREREIALLVATGLTNAAIATKVDLSPHTINYHLRQIFRKLGITSRAELAALISGDDGPR
ncbi:LuxR C-terminal-related transcriptional regulator [Catenuloplanes atrovinosus]|uniref:DNA-binding CsgD family transcriptional regulator n=1 Tax=Catenuloplanes atrovinosus TaxID=137266 RepID=A0AAE3YKJ5_9ACTN|nr:LuxR C-terminal-related transcriptional regulator [Catenuloplanes atrovinosus]MDR7273991.1 DNA-binding CsgD family transcriptional regulator [Catenuloplanes atrovinosus]